MTETMIKGFTFFALLLGIASQTYCQSLPKGMTYTPSCKAVALDSILAAKAGIPVFTGTYIIDEPKIQDIGAFMACSKSNGNYPVMDYSRMRTIYRVLVDEEGKVCFSCYLDLPEPSLDYIVAPCLEKLRFIPAKKDGKKVKCWITLPLYLDPQR